MDNVVDQIYKNAARYHEITVEELRRILVEEGKPLIHQYYVAMGYFDDEEVYDQRENRIHSKRI